MRARWLPEVGDQIQYWETRPDAILTAWRPWADQVERLVVTEVTETDVCCAMVRLRGSTPMRLSVADFEFRLAAA